MLAAVWGIYGGKHNHDLCIGGIGGGDSRPVATVSDVFDVRHVWTHCPFDPFGNMVVSLADKKMNGFELPELSHKGTELVIQAIKTMKAHNEAIQNRILLQAMFGNKG